MDPAVLLDDSDYFLAVSLLRKDHTFLNFLSLNMSFWKVCYWKKIKIYFVYSMITAILNFENN